MADALPVLREAVALLQELAAACPTGTTQTSTSH
jgi:hypothetical protein